MSVGGWEGGWVGGLVIWVALCCCAGVPFSRAQSNLCVVPPPTLSYRSGGPPPAARLPAAHVCAARARRWHDDARRCGGGRVLPVPKIQGTVCCVLEGQWQFAVCRKTGCSTARSVYVSLLAVYSHTTSLYRLHRTHPNPHTCQVARWMCAAATAPLPPVRCWDWTQAQWRTPAAWCSTSAAAR